MMSTNPRPETPNPELGNSLPDGAADRSPSQGDQASPQSMVAEESIAARPGAIGNDPPYKIGKGRPPLHSRFKPGQSGNPTGRRKGSKNEATLLRELLDETKLPLRVSGKVRRISIREAILRGIIEVALKRNLKSAQFLLSRHAALVAGEPVTSELSQDDEEIIKDYLRRRFKPEDGKGEP